jgi:hypothetical protein
MSPVTQTTAALDRDVHQALIASGIFGKADSGVVSALIEHMLPIRFPPSVVFAGRPAVVCADRVGGSGGYRHADESSAHIRASDVPVR